MLNMTISALRKAYLDGELTPLQVLQEISKRAADYEARNIWIYQLNETELTPYLEALDKKPSETQPLWGIPFAIKDNIDLAGIPTTAACAEFAYTPERSATVVQKLIDAGAIPVGKTNLDQFATGLNGTRSPYGACGNAFNPDYISGGSSSGSAVAVALGLSAFSLGTDTAGSGRVPACFNNLVGLKSSRGLLSNTGIVRACRSLDCISIFAFNTDDANAVLSVAEGYDETDEYSRVNPYSNNYRHYGTVQNQLKIAVLPKQQQEFFGDSVYRDAYQATIEKLRRMNVNLIEIDFTPFLETAKLLYEGPWVSERYLATLPLCRDNPEAMLDVIQKIILPGGELLATEAFTAQYRLSALKQQCLSQLKNMDCLLTPTTSKHFTISELLQDPITTNSQLGHYTNFVNLLDLCAIAIPTGFTENNLPFGVTLIADHFQDRKLLSIANTIQQHLQIPLGAVNLPFTETSTGTAQNISTNIEVVVCGAHMQDLPLNWQLTERGAVLQEKTTTADCYRLFALAGGPPYRPGLLYDKKNGVKIEVEIWSLPASEFGDFVANIPTPLGIGKVNLGDGRYYSGFICEPYGIENAVDITEFGGWTNYINQLDTD